MARLARTICVLAAATVWPCALAGELQIAPVSVEFAAGEQAETLTLKNLGKEPATVQVRTFRWSQVNGQDHLEPTDEIVAGPPMVQIAPGAEQVVRILARKAPAAGTQGTYRLLVDEIPIRVPGRITVALRLSLPVFLGGETARPASVAWSAGLSREGGIELIARNSGGRHVRFDGLKLTNGKTSSDAFGGYVLAGHERRWHIAAPALGRGARVSLRGNSDTGALDVSIAVQDRP